MKLLLDHCVNRRLASLLPHEVTTAAARGWQALTNGQLLAAAAVESFDAVITVDKNLRYQQNLSKLPVSVIELDVPDTRLQTLAALAPRIEQALAHVPRFRFVSLHTDGSIEVLAER